MYVEVAEQERRLEEHHRARPNGWGAAEGGEYELGEHRLYEEQQGGAGEDGGREEHHLRGFAREPPLLGGTLRGRLISCWHEGNSTEEPGVGQCVKATSG